LNIFDIKYYFSNNHRFWNSTPFLKILGSYCIGIVFGKCLPFEFEEAHFCVIIITTFLLSFQLILSSYLFKKQAYIGIFLIHLTLFSVGYLLALNQNPFNIKSHILNHHEDAHYYSGQITKEWTSGRKNRYMLEVNSALYDSVWVEKTGKILLIGDNNLVLKGGNNYVIRNKSFPITTSENIYNIDFFSFYKKQGIFLQQYVQQNDIVPLQPINGISFSKIGHQINDEVEAIFKSKFDSLTFSIVNALILGDKNDLDPETKESFQYGGIMHILAVSGLHVGIIYLFLHFSLGFIKRFPFGKVFYIFIVLFFLWSYAMITGWSNSVVRACIMFSLFLFSEMLMRKNQPINTTAVSAFIVLLINPNALFHISFQLSYAAVFSIILFYDRFYRLLQIKYQFFDYFWKIACVSMAAQIGTLPLTLYYFGNFQPYFLIFNLIAIPFAFFLLSGGLIVLLTSPLKYISDGIAFLINLMVDLVYAFITFLLQFLPPVIDININIWQCLILLVLILLIFGFIIRKKLSYFAFVPVCMILFMLFKVQDISGRKNQKGIEYLGYPSKAVVIYNGKEYWTSSEEDDRSRSVDFFTEQFRLSDRIDGIPHYENEQFELFSINNNTILKIKNSNFIIPEGSFFDYIIVETNVNRDYVEKLKGHSDHLIFD